MTRTLQFVLLYLPSISFAQTFLPMDTLKVYPAEIRAKVTDQTLLPVIFLTGHSTQPNIPIGEIRNRTWNTIDEIKKAVHNKD